MYRLQDALISQLQSMQMYKSWTPGGTKERITISEIYMHGLNSDLTALHSEIKRN
jgi:hypothetical protein